MLKLRLAFVLAFLAGCVIAVYFIYPTDKTRIIRVINKSGDAIVSKNIDGLMAHVAYHYRDDYGNGYLQVQEILQTAFNRLNDLEVERHITSVSVEDNSAAVELSVRVIASEEKNRGYLIGDAGQAATIKVFFEKISHKWLITKVEGVFEKSHGAF